MRKIFVASLSWNTTVEGLKERFGPIGEIEDAVLIKDRDTGRSRGFGFITFANSEDASRAIQELDNSELDGRNIKVSLAKERK